MMPSFAPSTAALSHPIRSTRWLSGGREGDSYLSPDNALKPRCGRHRIGTVFPDILMQHLETVIVFIGSDDQLVID